MSEYKCNNCGLGNFSEGRIDKIFNVNGKLVLVENIPALICDNCQDVILRIETAERIRVMLNSSIKPKSYISTEVFDYA